MPDFKNLEERGRPLIRLIPKLTPTVHTGIVILAVSIAIVVGLYNFGILIADLGRAVMLSTLGGLASLIIAETVREEIIRTGTFTLDPEDMMAFMIAGAAYFISGVLVFYGKIPPPLKGVTGFLHFLLAAMIIMER